VNFGDRGPLVPSTLARIVDAYDRERWATFLLSAPGFSNDVDEADWVPSRPLGQGAFGKVALWERRSPDTGAVADRMAIKQRPLTQDTTAHGQTYQQDLAMEAVIQSQLCSVSDPLLERSAKSLIF
jgi:hypothetical protein